MARVLITGSSAGIGLVAARQLIVGGHRVMLHARNAQRATEVQEDVEGADGVVIGDLGDFAEVHALAEQVNRLGRFDAIIHNAGIYPTGSRETAENGLPSVLVVNALAPYMLTLLIAKPSRLVFVSSDMHPAGGIELDDLDWSRRRWNAAQAYSDTKLYITTLAFAVARAWPEVCAHAVDPGWVPTRMGGPDAPDDIDLGALSLGWLATSDEPSVSRSGGFWYHQQQVAPAPAALHTDFQDRLLSAFGALTGEQFC